MNSYLFMAISRGTESTEGAPIKRYTGVAPCFVKLCNPNKRQLEEAFGREIEDEPEYVTETELDENGAKVKYPQVRLSFLTQPDPEKVGFDAGLIPVNLYLTKKYRYNKDNTKVQVIDKYGRTAWVTIEQAKNHEIPMYSNGPANLDKDYRPAYIGEEDLTNFIIAYLNIPSPMKYNKTEKKWYMNDNASDSECRLDHIEDYFKGNFSEVQEMLTYQPKNKVKILFGVKTNDEGKQYQAVYTQMFLKNNVTDYERLKKDLEASKEAGRYGTTEFVVGPFKEYTVEETDFSNTSNGGNNPFENTGVSDNPWDAGNVAPY